jgi:hypothetical protein
LRDQYGRRKVGLPGLIVRGRSEKEMPGFFGITSVMIEVGGHCYLDEFSSSPIAAVSQIRDCFASEKWKTCLFRVRDK